MLTRGPPLALRLICSTEVVPEAQVTRLALTHHELYKKNKKRSCDSTTPAFVCAERDSWAPHS